MAVVIIILSISAMLVVGRKIINDTIEGANQCIMEQCPMCDGINDTECLDECNATCYATSSEVMI